LAFEDGLGIDPSQPQEEDYVLSATGIMWKTLNLWKRKFVQYVVLVGLASVIMAFSSFILIFTLFGLIGVLPEDPINYVFGIFTLSAPPEMTILVITIIFGVFAFVVNAILSGAAIKFALDDYSGLAAELGESFSQSFGKIGRILTIQLLLTLIVSSVTGPSLGFIMRAFDEIDLTPPIDPYTAFSPEAMQYLMMGMVLLIVGGIVVLVFAIKFAPAIAVVMDTDLSAIDSLKRSWELTSGKFIHVLGSQFCISFAVGFLSLVVTLPLTFLLPPLDPLVLVIETIILGLLFSARSLIFISVLYRDLLARGGHEGSDLPEYVL
jgi:hypothetical protein